MVNWKDKEEVKEYNRKYFQDNKENLRLKHADYVKKWKKLNPDKVREYWKKNKKRANIRNYANKHFKKELLEKFKECQECGCDSHLVMHHKRYTKNKGDIVILCVNCHKEKHKSK